MNILQAIVLGVIQGLGEFLPISSSGHMLLAEMLLGIETGNAYTLLTVLMHVGTLIPILIVFWKDWMGMLFHPVANRRLWLMLIIASVPALAVHMLGFDEMFENGWFLGVSFAITALMLLITELSSAKAPRVEEPRLPGIGQGIVMGIFQAFALLPGISRSGSTISGGIFAGLDRKSAARFSFMMSAPAVAGSLLIEGKHALEEGTFAAFDPIPMILAIVVAAVVGYLAIRFMLDLINRISLAWFSLYLGILAVAYLLLQMAGSPLVAAFAVPPAV